MVTAKRTGGFIITGELLLSGIFFMLVGVFGFNFFSDDQVTTTISIEPQANHFTLDEEIVIDVTISSRVPINALDAKLTFPPEFLEVKEIISENTTIDLWVFEPDYSNEEGFVSFTGGTTKPGGVVGTANILTIVFTPIQSGNIKLDFTHSLVLQHDGLGTDADEALVDADFIVNELENPDQANVVKRTATAEYVIEEGAPASSDLDNDGEVTIKDLSAFLPSLKQKYTKTRDFNSDGKINLKDLSIIMSNVLRK